MEIKLIDGKRDRLILPEKNIIDRRQVLLYSIVAPTLAFLPKEKAQAFWPILASIVARSVIRGVARAVGRSVSRRVVGGVGAYASFSKRVQARVVEEVATDLTEAGITAVAKTAIHALAKESPQGLWSRRGEENPLNFQIKNETDSHIETKFSLDLIDIETRRLEKSEPLFTVEAKPKASGQFNYGVFEDIPRIGNKRVIGVTPSDVKGLKITPSGKVLVMNPEKIYA